MPTPVTAVRLTEEQKARAEVVAEDVGASSIADGIRVALLDSERKRGLAAKTAARLAKKSASKT